MVGQFTHYLLMRLRCNPYQSREAFVRSRSPYSRKHDELVIQLLQSISDVQNPHLMNKYTILYLDLTSLKRRENYKIPTTRLEFRLIKNAPSWVNNDIPFLVIKNLPFQTPTNLQKMRKSTEKQIDGFSNTDQ